MPGVYNGVPGIPISTRRYRCTVEEIGILNIAKEVVGDGRASGLLPAVLMETSAPPVNGDSARC